MSLEETIWMSLIVIVLYLILYKVCKVSDKVNDIDNRINKTKKS